MADLIFEIGAEEIPSGDLDAALAWLLKNAQERIAKARLSYDEVTTCGTPRRLVLMIRKVAAHQSDVSEEITGPKAEIAFDKSGGLTKAGLGFVRSKKCTAEKAYKKKTDKGEVIAVQFNQPGLSAEEVLPELLAKLMQDIPFSKTMKWDDSGLVFIRPVRWLLCLLGSKVLPVKFGSLEAGAKTCGHRFLSPKFTAVKSLDAYLKYLDDNWVMLDGQKRKDVILKQSALLAKKIKGEPRVDEELLEIVKNLVEYPFPVLGHFEEKYLKMPQEILICEMREHQKYFAINGKKDELLAAFVVVAGTRPVNEKDLAAGNARVLKARFEDGVFYYDEDKKVALKDYVPRLEKVQFQRGLGSLFDKTKRIENLVAKICDSLAVSKKTKAQAQQVANLCKADLVTGVVAQFPELQGVMGGHYASLSGEDAAVALGIKEHYLPKNAKDVCPSTDLGAIVSLADKIDSITAVIGIGKLPKGSADPFSLRRQAIGFVKILLDRAYKMSLPDLIKAAVDNVKDFITLKPNDLETEVFKFIDMRARGIIVDDLKELKSKNPTLICEAVMSAGRDDLTDAWARAKALNSLELKNESIFIQLAATFKRVSHIVKKAQPGKNLELNQKTVSELLSEPSEKKLLQEVFSVRKRFAEVPDENHLVEHYTELLKIIAKLKPFVDEFFDKNMVMVDDDKLRNARLGLLYEIEKQASMIADFTKIAIDGN